MLSRFSTDALKSAHEVLKGSVHVSHLETLLKAALPLVREIVEKELEERTKEVALPSGEQQAAKIPAPGSAAKN